MASTSSERVKTGDGVDRITMTCTVRREWVVFALQQLANASRATTPGNFNYAMIEAAAVCVAAVESSNRKAEKAP
jgi:hypothetical protein